MHIIRSTRCSIKPTTSLKKNTISSILSEYSRVVNIFIDKFIDSNITKTMRISSQICELTLPQNSFEFDAWLKLRSVGNGIGMDIPIRFHRQFHNLNLIEGSSFNHDFVISKDYIQFSWTIDTGPKRTEGKLIGIDTGINALASLSDGTQLGTDIKALIEKIKRCKHGSKRQKRLRKTLKYEMDRIAKQITSQPNIRLIVVEKLKGLNKNSATQRRVSKNIRRSLGAWAYRYWLTRVEQGCEMNRVSFRSVPPRNTSRKCSRCGYIEKGNRCGEVFLCRSCGYADNADTNAAKNVLNDYLTGPYGASFQTKIVDICP